jgi:hypothetical protein
MHNPLLLLKRISILKIFMFKWYLKCKEKKEYYWILKEMPKKEKI